MIKRTLYFGNPAYLSLKLGQLVVYKPASGEEKKEVVKTIPVEDIASVVLDNKQITITQALLESLLKRELRGHNLRFLPSSDRADATS